MKKKNIILNESQLKRLLENRVNEVNAEEIGKMLSNIECTGEDLKKLLTKKVVDQGYEDVRVKYMGNSEDGDLMYFIYTEGPVFVVKAKSNIDSEIPCLNIYDVTVYKK